MRTADFVPYSSVTFGRDNFTASMDKGENYNQCTFGIRNDVLRNMEKL